MLSCTMAGVTPVTAVVAGTQARLELSGAFYGPGSTIRLVCPDNEVIDERLAYYVGINNLMGMVGALGSQGLADERELLRHAGQVLATLADEHGERLRLASLLREEPVLRCKANLLTRVRQMDELTGPLQAQSVYVDVRNPIPEAYA